MGVAFFSWIVGGYLIDSLRKDAQEQVVIQVSDQVKSAIADIEKEKIASNFPDYNSLISLNKLVITTNFESWTPNATKDPRKVETKIVLDKGEIAQGYLYIKASVEEKALSRWESIYVQMNYRGGHLLRTKGLPVPVSEKTELLYALDDISYVTTVPYRENDDYSKTSWLNLFSNGAEIRIDAFISSLKPAVIEEMILYYVCKDGSECSLTLE
jgi:hypothetical protein